MGVRTTTAVSPDDTVSHETTSELEAGGQQTTFFCSSRHLNLRRRRRLVWRIIHDDLDQKRAPSRLLILLFSNATTFPPRFAENICSLIDSGVSRTVWTKSCDPISRNFSSIQQLCGRESARSELVVYTVESVSGRKETPVSRRQTTQPLTRMNLDPLAGVVVQTLNSNTLLCSREADVGS